MIINGGILQGGTYRDQELPLPRTGLQLYLDAGNPASYSGTGSTWYDLTDQGYQAAINSGMTYSAANGGIFNFDGTTNAFAQVGAGFGYDYSAGLTVNVWAKFTTGGGNWERLIDFGNGEGPPDGYNIILARNNSDSTMVMDINGLNDSALVPGEMPITWDGWAMYTMYTDGTNWKQFKNGEFFSVESNTDVPATVTRNNNYIGRSNWASDAYYTGSMSVVQFYNRALNDTEIAQCYNYFRGRYGL